MGCWVKMDRGPQTSDRSVPPKFLFLCKKFTTEPQGTQSFTEKSKKLKVLNRERKGGSISVSDRASLFRLLKDV